MTKSSNPSDGRRIGLRAVAKAAGVSLMTASLVMRNSPRISVATRQRVRELADKLGYRPDPEISRLMGRLRPSRKTRGSVVIGLIDLQSTRPTQVHPYTASVRQGAIARAESLGFGVSVFLLSDYAGNLAQVLRVIRHRGIEGLVLLPSAEPVVFDPKLDWDGISVVAATTTIASPEFHQVVPDQLHNIKTLIENLHRRGYRRISAIFSESLETRTSQNYSIALTWHGYGRRILVLPDAMNETAASRKISAWIEEHTPDVILGGEIVMRLLRSRKLARVPAGIVVVALTSPPDDRTSYLDQRPGLIGECAVSVLTGMMHNHETGVPADPQVTAIRGVLRDTKKPASTKPRAGTPSGKLGVAGRCTSTGGGTSHGVKLK